MLLTMETIGQQQWKKSDNFGYLIIVENASSSWEFRSSQFQMNFVDLVETMFVTFKYNEKSLFYIFIRHDENQARAVSI